MKYKEGYKYQVVKHYYIQTDMIPVHHIRTLFLDLSKTGLLTINPGYAWNGASGPTFDKGIGWGKFKIKLTDTQVPTLVHDAFAQLMRMGLLGQEWLHEINALLDKMLKERGMWWVRRLWWRRGLKMTRGSFASPRYLRKILESI